MLPKTLFSGVILLVLATAASAQQGMPPPKVTVVTLHSEDVTLTTTLPGRVVASGVAEVRPQVAGIIQERLFAEGAVVERGDELYRIDSASYEAQVAAADAAVAQAQATLSVAIKEAERVQTLLDRKVVSQQNVDDAVSTRDGAAAALKVAQAQLLSANIDLDRTTIRAPLSGVVGRSLTTQGALVTAGQAEPLAVIRKLDPVFVDVTQSAAEIIRWRRDNPIEAFTEIDTTVRLILADGQPYSETGELKAAEPHVDEQTGVIVLRLQFSNPDRLLLPGMYVQVEMPQGVLNDVILAPQAAVNHDQNGNATAMVVNADNVVEPRVLNVVRDSGTNWVVTDGLSEGDKLIVEGFQKIAPGATVVPEERTQDAAPASAQQN